MKEVYGSRHAGNIPRWMGTAVLVGGFSGDDLAKVEGGLHASSTGHPRGFTISGDKAVDIVLVRLKAGLGRPCLPSCPFYGHCMRGLF